MADWRGRNGSEALQVRSELRDGVAIVRPIGDVDLTGSPTLKMEIRKVATASVKLLIIDVGGVAYMDSSGVATLVEAMQLARRGQMKLVLCALQPKVKSIFEIARLDTVFTIVDTLETALSK